MFPPLENDDTVGSTKASKVRIAMQIRVSSCGPLLPLQMDKGIQVHELLLLHSSVVTARKTDDADRGARGLAQVLASGPHQAQGFALWGPALSVLNVPTAKPTRKHVRAAYSGPT